MSSDVKTELEVLAVRDVSVQEMDISLLVFPWCSLLPWWSQRRWLSGSIMPFKMNPHAVTPWKLSAIPVSREVKGQWLIDLQCRTNFGV